MTFGEILRLAAQRAPRKCALIADDRCTSFLEYHQQANRFAHLLLSLGLRTGDRVLCVLFNGPDYGVVHFGNARAGTVLVHVSPMYAAPEIAAIIERTRPKVVVIDETVQHKIRSMTPGFGSVHGLIVTGDAQLEGALRLDAALATQPDSDPGQDIDPAAPVAMTFTGGTTGRPKGAVVNHTARYVSAVTTALEHRLASNDVTAAVTPMFHAVGLMIWYQATVICGCTSVVFSRWDAADFIRKTEQHRISSAFLVPVQVRDMLRSPEFDRDRLKSLVNIGVAGAASPPDLIAECRAALPHCDYTDHYGQSETGPLTILKPWEMEQRSETIGRAAIGVDLRIVDADGVSMPPGEIGELIARGPFLMEEYFEDEDETAGYFRNGDGWGWTGDLAVADKDGFITLVGRSREMIVSGGINIYPREVEDVVAAHEQVAECIVFGVPDERWGEALVAYVVVEPGASVTKQILLDHCTDRLARYKRPRDIVFVSEIPKTASGKVRKPLLRDAYLDGRILP